MIAVRHPLLAVAIEREEDVVAVRQRARRVGELLGFDGQDQTRIATAVSEIARNAYAHGRSGRAEFLLETWGQVAPMLVVRITDRGRGIADVTGILEGAHQPAVGQGRGLIAARRLVDRFSIDSKIGQGTTVELGKMMSRPVAMSGFRPTDIAAALARESAGDMLTALRDQSRELTRSLDELNTRQEELERLNLELADTNRGVIALYAELEDKAEQLKQASELKSRFLSYMSHEFRTPLNSILALSRLLLDHVDGPLTSEQERQIRYIRQSTESLTELVNDLLDLAKVEAGRLDVKPVVFTVPELFGGLRGALRPLLTSGDVELIFDDVPENVPLLSTDESKVGQILRNFISNALKFTTRGEVRVLARFDRSAGRVLLQVQDTGIGIDPPEHERLFQEFSQIDNPLQRSVKGTGLGLPLSRRLAVLLGGDILVDSAVGAGSTFTLSIPPVFGESAAEPTTIGPARDAQTRRVLVVDDEEAFRYVFRQMIGGEHQYEIIEAVNGLEALRRARQDRPDVIVLDLQMPELDGYATLRELSSDPATREMPVIVSTSSVIDNAMRARLTQAVAVVSKENLSRQVICALLQEIVTKAEGAAR
jgi:signal transduction histidine kinase/ActR/RegA family two-component response regulator